jgi:hypothetical protein
MRINKELRSLTNHFEITFIGIGKGDIKPFGEIYCKYFYLIKGKRNRPITMLKQFFLAWRLIRKTDTIHIINEQLMIFFYPLLFRKHVVLDVFDSLFLRINKSGKRWSLIKRIIYAPVNKILVTDENRKNLMPSFCQKKISILQNYPNKYTGPLLKTMHNDVTILYYGWMGINRGTDLIEKLLAVSDQIHVIMAGWFSDSYTKKLTKHPQVDFRGVLLQADALQIAAVEADYILCAYAPINENTINASPNKIYDSIQVRTPVIINEDIIVPDVVIKYQTGVIIPKYDVTDPEKLVNELIARKGTFKFDDQLIENFTWEKIEQVLIEAHQL